MIVAAIAVLAGHGPALDLMLRKVEESYPNRYTTSSEPLLLNTKKIPARREFRQ
jgi:hypothetical protein